MEGVGKYTSKDGREFEGEWLRGNRKGHGVELLPTGERYDGQWVANKRHGPGSLRLSNGKLRDGTWKAGQLVAWRSEEVRAVLVCVCCVGLSVTCFGRAQYLPAPPGTEIDDGATDAGAGVGAGAGAGAGAAAVTSTA